MCGVSHGVYGVLWSEVFWPAEISLIDTCTRDKNVDIFEKTLDFLHFHELHTKIYEN